MVNMNRRALAILVCILPCVGATTSPHAKLGPVGLTDSKWTGGLMGQRFDVCRDVSIPSMWEIMSGTQYSQFLENFRIAAGVSEGRHRGPTFNDGDFYKFVEAASAVYVVNHDPKLDTLLDESIAMIAKAQRSDGYLHTPVLLKKGGPETQEFQNPLHFEMYNMGHLMTAACVHHRATGKTTLLDVAKKCADFLDAKFKRPTPELAAHGVCPSHYMGLVELAREMNEPRYLALASRLIDMRELVKDGTDDNQDRVPFRKQTTAIGHAVRANYLYAGAADVYAENGDVTLLSPLEQIWSDLVTKKLYITGGCGALYDGASPDGSRDQKNITRVHQAYGRDYQLPNATAHNESCAAIGNLLWNWRMLEITADARYADVIERTLYNGVLAAVGLEGKTYFYTNPLRKIDPAPVALRWSRTRQPYMSTFCCPPNVVRTIAESANYAYAKSDRGIWVNLYGASECTTAIDGTTVKVTQETSFPWDGKIRLTIASKLDRPKEFGVMLRIPQWAGNASVKVKGEAQPAPQAGKYMEIRRAWAAGDVVELDFPMPVRMLEANPNVEETRNQAAIVRGPIVYCLESNDLPQGVRVSDVRLDRAGKFSERFDKALGGVVVIEGKALAVPSPANWSGQLYRELDPTPTREIDVKLVPYFAWGNRGDSEMSVWLPLGK
jgi:DUF1680 family protein